MLKITSIHKHINGKVFGALDTWKVRSLNLYNNWREQRFLKRYNVSSREQYNRIYDPSINIKATRLIDFYHGYACYFVFQNRNHSIYKDYEFINENIINEWCKKNLKCEFRFDMHRIVETHYGWETNELGGGDYVVVAFKDNKDYMWFTLKWSH